MKKLALLFVLVVGIAVPAMANDNNFNEDETALDHVVQPQAVAVSPAATFVPGVGNVCPWGYRLQWGTFVQYQWVRTLFGYRWRPVTVTGWQCVYP